MTTTTIDSSSLSRAVEQLKKEVAVLQRQVRQLAGLLRTKNDGPIGPPASTRRDFGPVEKRAFHDVVMTVADAAEALDLGEEQVRRLLRAEKLAGIPLGGRAGWQVSRESVMEMVAARQTFSRPRTATVARKVRTQR